MSEIDRVAMRLLQLDRAAGRFFWGWRQRGGGRRILTPAVALGGLASASVLCSNCRHALGRSRVGRATPLGRWATVMAMDSPDRDDSFHTPVDLHYAWSDLPSRITL